MSEDSRPSRILVNSRVSNDYILRLARPITEVDDFEEEFQLFLAAGPSDTIKIDLVTPGGSLDTAHLLKRAILTTQAKTIAYIGPTCASAGTALALACDEWEVDEMSSFMIHTASYGYVGTAPNVKANVEHSDKMIERFVRTTYAGFLSEAEIVTVLDGKELYFEGEELAERLVEYAEYRDELRRAYAEEDEEPVDTPVFAE